MFAKFKRENFFVTPFIRGVPVSFISLLESTIVQLLPPINILLKKDQDKNLLQSYFEKIDLYQRKISTDSSTDFPKAFWYHNQETRKEN